MVSTPRKNWDDERPLERRARAAPALHLDLQNHAKLLEVALEYRVEIGVLEKES
jgi:hypothetical protein